MVARGPFVGWSNAWARGAAGILVALLAWPATARAQAWQGTLTVASDHVVRGLSHSDGRPAWLADLSWSNDTGWAAALGLASPAYPQRGGDASYSLALGRSRQLDADWRVQAQLAHYGVAGSAAARRYGYDELSARVAWRGRAQLALAWAPNTALPSGQAARTAPALTAALSWHQRLAGPVALDAGLARVRLRDGAARVDYAYGSVGLGWSHGPMQLHLTAIGGEPPVDGVVWVAAAGWTF